MIIWFAIYPIVVAAILGLSFTKIFLQSLYVLPLLIFIGIFNPIMDNKIVFSIGSLGISNGWITFSSIILRGLLAVESVLILIEKSGFLQICRGLRNLGIPSFLTNQLLFVYRYLTVLLLEMVRLRRAIDSRGFGRKHLPMKLWGKVLGQLFIRTIDRSDRIYQSMLARGFTGEMPPPMGTSSKIKTQDVVYCLSWILLFICLRIFNFSVLIFN